MQAWLQPMQARIVVDQTLLGLGRHQRVADQCPRHGHEVGLPGRHHLLAFVGLVDASGDHHGHADDLFHPLRQWGDVRRPRNSSAVRCGQSPESVADVPATTLT